ncbi:MAG: DedA family protein [Actinomycetota bacterium]|nr:DedA family protein [Actinomycetota bacterium]
MSVLLAAEEVGGLAGWVVDVIERIGAPGVGALVALETAFPPIPSEVILPFAGFSASRGDVNVVLAWVAATLGALIGAWVLYGIGALLGQERLRSLAEARWFPFFSASDLTRGERFFERHGERVVLLGRCVPLVRSVVSVPAGVERMPLARFTLLTAVGSGVWNALFIGAGYQLGNRWERVEGWVQPISYAVVGLLALAALWLVVRKVRTVRAEPT